MNPSLAEQLSAVMAYRNAPDHPPESVQSNWTVVPANDNKAQVAEVDYSFERHLRMTPSVQEIMRQVELGPVERNDVGQIIGIGKLRFSDGTQHERAYTLGPDGDVIRYQRRAESGAMLHTREQVEAMLGGRGYSDADLHNSNAYYADVLGTQPARYIKRTKRRNGPSMTAEQSRANLAQAIANTEVMPPITKCAPGLPCGTERVGDCFVGYLKPATGKTGSVAWEDFGQTIENAKVWRRVRQALRSGDKAALDAAMTAQSLEDVGVAVGQSLEYARRKGGKRALLAANDNLSAAINKHVA
jgi:hypothetical protein